MNPSFTAIYKQEGAWWVGWVEEVPGVNAQEATKEELFESLKVALDEALEFNCEDARKPPGKTTGKNRCWHEAPGVDPASGSAGSCLDPRGLKALGVGKSGKEHLYCRAETFRGA